MKCPAKSALPGELRLGNTAPRAIEESFGIMVNYLYDHKSIEDNHEAFVRVLSCRVNQARRASKCIS